MSLQRYSVAEMRFTGSVMTWKSGDFTYTTDSAGNVYLIPYGENKLYTLSEENGRRLLSDFDSAVKEILSGSNIDLSICKASVVGDVFDGRVHLAIYDDIHSANFTYDTASGTFDEVAIPVTDPTGEERDILIVNESERYFFALTGFAYIPTVQYAGGNEYAFEEYVTQYGLIAKDDYWASRNNILYFDDLVH